MPERGYKNNSCWGEAIKIVVAQSGNLVINASSRMQVQLVEEGYDIVFFLPTKDNTSSVILSPLKFMYRQLVTFTGREICNNQTETT